MALYWRRDGASTGARHPRASRRDGDSERAAYRRIHPMHEATWAIDATAGGEGGQIEASLPNFAVMRRLAMRFRGILRGHDPTKLDGWLKDARETGLYGIKRFVSILQRDIDAVRNAVSETWSNGQTEGQINRLKTLKRSMYGRAGTELLRARMLPFRS
jgi:transposase